MDRLNFFNPYKDKDNTHEDVLTRNFLILVKHIHAVQTAFFETIRNKMPSIGLESIAAGELSVNEVHTQISSGNYLSGEVGRRLLSIIISDDELVTEHPVQKSDRKARYDGVILCDPSWLFIIENKPSVGNIWEGQLDPNNEDANGNIIIQEPCCLSWRETISMLTDVMERNTSSDIEREMIGDFLEYINENYSGLNPYRRLGLCKSDRTLINLRCADILKECYPGKEIKKHKGWNYCINNAAEDNIIRLPALFYDNDNKRIKLCMFAGAVMTGARAFYKNLRLERFKELLDDEHVKMKAVPEFRLLCKGDKIVEFDTSHISPDKYVAYWKETELRQLTREDIQPFYDKIVKDKVIKADDKALQEKVLGHKYDKINVSPAISLEYEWPLGDAIDLDDADKLVDECRKRIENIYSLYR